MRTALERAVLSCARHFVVTPSGSSMHITQRQVIDMDNLPPHTHLHTHTPFKDRKTEIWKEKKLTLVQTVMGSVGERDL